MSDQYNPNTDPNKVKKCACEDKYGPKPFNPYNPEVNSTKNNNRSK